MGRVYCTESAALHTALSLQATPTRLQLLAQLVAVELHIHTRYRRIPYYITYSITVRTLTDLWIRFALAKPKRKSQKKDVGVGSW